MQMPIRKKQIVYIDNSQQLEQYCNTCMQEQFVTIDTEFVREKYYYPKLCLIQIATSNTIAIIDPIVDNLNLMPLKSLLLNNNILKVLHSARQDIEIFYNLFKAMPNNIYDTQIGAMVCGFGDSIGYEKIVKQLIDVKINKSVQITDWEMRPLTTQQKDYAADDVWYLREIYTKLCAEIIKNNRQTWIVEECDKLLQSKYYETDLNSLFYKLKLQSFNINLLNRAYEIIQWREQIAQSINKPRKRIMSDEVIINIARQNPNNPKKINSIRNLNRQFVNRGNLDSLLERIKKANLQKNAIHPPISQYHKKNYDTYTYELLKIILKYSAEQNKVAQSLIANTSDLMQIIESEEKADIPALKGWRKDVFGNLALQFMKNEKYTMIKNKTFKIVDTNNTIV